MSHEECQELPVTERCIDCIADYYQDKRDIEADAYLEREV